MTPLVKMHTLGSTFVPPPFHAGGLRYHGMAPLVSHLHELGLIEARAYTQTEVLRGRRRVRARRGDPPGAGGQPRRQGGDRRGRCAAARRAVSQAILFNLCGHGHFDMQAYIDYCRRQARDHAYAEEEVALALAGLPPVAA